jgi:hypothetical protein
VLVILSGLLAGPRAALGRPPDHQSTTSPVPLIAMGLHGDLYTLRADDTGLHRLTTSGRAKAPLLSPDGRRIVYFLAAPHQQASVNPTGAIYVVPVNSPTGMSGQQVGGSAGKWYDARYSWSPDGSLLAYRRGASFVLHALDGRRADTILPPPHGTGYAGDLVWSSDGRQIAAPLTQLALRVIPQSLLVAVATPPSIRWHVVTLRLPTWALGMRMAGVPWATPSDELAWTPNGRGFLFSTLAIHEGPPDVSGIWQVSASGGLAHLAIGTAAGLRDPRLRRTGPLAGATHFQLSPNGTLLATDPLQRLWVGRPDGQAGRLLPARVPRLCVLAQYIWLRDSSGLAYVQLCSPDGQSSRGQTPAQELAAQATLFSVRLDSATPRQLYRASSADQQAIDLTASYQCVLCGY